MPKRTYGVSVEKTLYCTGMVMVDASSPDQAIEIVDAQITEGELQVDDIEWSEAQYEGNTFQVTGDVD